MQEKIVETKNCKQCNIQFNITDKDLEFYRKISPKIWWEIFEIPAPSLCPECRLQRRLSWRNIRNLYRAKSSLSWKEIIWMYKPDSWYPINDTEEWWSDNWDELAFGLDYDFDKSFFEQFEELMFRAPMPSNSLTLSTIEKSNYINWATSIKNWYLSFNMFQCDWIFYSEGAYYCNNIFDCYSVDNVENSYECVNCKNLTTCFFSLNLSDSSNCYYCFDSSELKECIWCVNLYNKSYCIFNKQYSKQDYIVKKQELLEKLSLLKELSFKFYNNQIKRENFNINAENCVWEYIINSNKCVDSYNIVDSENLKYCYFIKNWWYDSYDLSLFWNNTTNCYEICIVWNNANNCIFCFWIFWDVKNLIYCIQCNNWCHDCFWCIGLKNKSYCIFNKQYTKEEYEELVPKIIKQMKNEAEWWEFFPASISYFWYNESTAIQHFPLNQKSALKSWFKWSDYEAPFPKVKKIIPANALPNNINDIPDDILNRAIECEITKKPFRIISQELEFYRKYNLTIPKRHPDQRFFDRFALVNWIKNYERKCEKCWKDIVTTYSSEREDIVYCQNCYDKEVY